MATRSDYLETPQSELAYCPIDLEMLPFHRFKVLCCGHCFCETCLEEWSQQNLFNCPKCRVEESRNVEDLDDMFSHVGPLFVDQPPEEIEPLEIQSLLHKQLIRRARTIRILKGAVETMASIEQTGAGVKIGGAVGGLIGTGLMIGGSIAALTGIGAPVGIPVALAGAALGGASGLTVGGGVAVEAILKSRHLKDSNEHLNSDYFGAIQLRIILGRAARNPTFAEKIDFPAQDAASLVGILGRIAKFSTASVAFARAIAAGLARGVANVGLHVAGIVISAVLIPIDLYQLITSSIKIHKKENSKVVQDIETLAHDLENELFRLLKDREYNIVELNRFDNDKNKHTMLLAVEGETETPGNKSYDDILKSNIVILDQVGETEESAYFMFIEKWHQIGALNEVANIEDSDYLIVEGDDDYLL